MIGSPAYEREGGEGFDASTLPAVVSGGAVRFVGVVSEVYEFC